jgi:hypothetical protein
MRYWRIVSSIFTGLLLGLLILGRMQLFRDPGTLWHVVVEEEILSTGRLMTTEPFSCTRAESPWFGRQWLAECALAMVHRLSRLDGLLLATASLLAAFNTWAAHRLIRAGIHWLLAGFLVAVALGASTFHFHPRPHLTTLVLVGWTFAQLCDFEAGRSPLERLCWLVPTFLLWTNAHGGVVCGIATLALTVAAWGLTWLIGALGPIHGGRELSWFWQSWSCSAG